MTLIRVRDPMVGIEEWWKRERQEACDHTLPNAASAFLTGVIFSWRYDPEFDRYKSGPTYRRVCQRCDLVIDIAVPSPLLKPIIALNAPSPGWMRAHGYENWTIEEREIGREEQVQSRYQQDQHVRQSLRDGARR